MRYAHLLVIATTLLFSAGCASLDCKPNKATTLPGTDTAVVALYVDKSGYPQTTIDSIKVYPGQKIIFAGPDRFEIVFKEQRSPIGKLEAPSSNGIVVIDIPKDIFEREQRESKSNETKKEIVYRYGIRVNGKLTDPEIVIARR